MHCLLGFEPCPVDIADNHCGRRSGRVQARTVRRMGIDRPKLGGTSVEDLDCCLAWCGYGKG